MSNQLFKHKKEFDEQFVTVPFVDYFVDPAYYNVDREVLISVLSKERRTGVALFSSSTPLDKTILQTLTRFVATSAKHIAKRFVSFKLDVLKEQSFAYLNGEVINISLISLLDHRLPFFTRINIICALTFHELFHCLYTTKELGNWLLEKGVFITQTDNSTGLSIKTPDFLKSAMLIGSHPFLKSLINILEDRRIETLGLRKFPGYVFYFDDLRKYAIWQQYNMLQKIIQTDSDKLEKHEKEFKTKESRQLFYYIFYKVLAPELLQEWEKLTICKSEGLKNKIVEVDLILSDEIKTFKAVCRQSKLLFDLFDKDDLPQEEQSFYDCIVKIKISTEEEKQLTEALEAAFDEVLNEGQDVEIEKKEKISPILKRSKTDPVDSIKIVVAKAERKDFKLFQEAQKLATALTSNLSFLDSRFNRTLEQFELNAGDLDDDELYSLNFNKNIFYEEEETPTYNLDFGILIDESGSMSGPKTEQAKLATLGLALSLKNNKFVNLFIYGHTADNGESEDLTLYQYIDPTEKRSKLDSLFSISARSSNADGYAIGKMGEILQKGKARQKVLVIISDGYPSASCYKSYDEGMKHVKSVVTLLESKGFFIIQIAVDNIKDSNQMFTHFIPYDGTTLGTNLRKVLTQKLIEVSNQI